VFGNLLLSKGTNNKLKSPPTKLGGIFFRQISKPKFY
jgi:hypothetical protein